MVNLAIIHIIHNPIYMLLYFTHQSAWPLNYNATPKSSSHACLKEHIGASNGTKVHFQSSTQCLISNNKVGIFVNIIGTMWSFHAHKISTQKLQSML